jgi:hypothetical protein
MGHTQKWTSIVRAAIFTERGVAVRIQDYRENIPNVTTRAQFVGWLNEKLEEEGCSLSISYLRDLEYGRKVPSLRLAVAVEKVTGGSVSVREWPGLSRRS